MPALQFSITILGVEAKNIGAQITGTDKLSFNNLGNGIVITVQIDISNYVIVENCSFR